MSIRFNADEIFEVAEQIEINGGRFYRRAAEFLTEPAVQRLMTGLAAAEDEHRKIFASMRAELSAKERGDTFAHPDEELSAYLRAWADGQIFDMRVDPAEGLTGTESAEDILQTALAREKDTVVFYLGLKDAVPEKWGRGKIDHIINEEMRHVARITTEIANLRKEIS